MDLGRIFIIIGIILVVIGFIYITFPSNGGFPKLPGDIMIKRGNFTFYFPVVTSIILSIIISVILLFINRR